MPAAAPVPVPAPPAGYHAPEDPMSEWERVIAALEKKPENTALAGVYSHARLLGWSTNSVELGFAKDSFQAGRGTDPDNVARLKAFLGIFTGTPLEVKVKAIQGLPQAAAGGASAAPPVDSGSSVAEVENERKRVERDKREREARQHPSTQAAIDVLGAVIKEIKVDG